MQFFTCFFILFLFLFLLTPWKGYGKNLRNNTSIKSGLTKTITRLTGHSLSQGNVPHVYYLCDTYVIHVWCFRCIYTQLIHLYYMCQTLVIHLVHTYNTGIKPFYFCLINCDIPGNIQNVNGFDPWIQCDLCDCILCLTKL